MGTQTPFRSSDGEPVVYGGAGTGFVDESDVTSWLVQFGQRVASTGISV
jgi:hypothetical protein